jgi:hypothetical protein
MHRFRGLAGQQPGGFGHVIRIDRHPGRARLDLGKREERPGRFLEQGGRAAVPTGAARGVSTVSPRSDRCRCAGHRSASRTRRGHRASDGCRCRPPPGKRGCVEPRCRLHPALRLARGLSLACGRA